MVKSLYLGKMMYRAAEVAWTRGAGGRLSCIEGSEGLWPATVQRCEEQDCNSRVWAKRHTILCNLQEENLVAKGKVVEYLSRAVTRKKRQTVEKVEKKVHVCCEDEVTKLRRLDFWWTFSLSPWPTAKLALHVPVTGQDYRWTLLLLFQNVVLIQAGIL